MKRLISITMITVFGVAVAALTRAPSVVLAGIGQQQPHGGGPGRVELDNPTVRVLRMRLAPHERIPMHQLGARLVIWLTNAHLRDSLSTGRIELVDKTAGDVSWVPAQRHAGQNLGDSAVEFIAVEVKARR